VVGKCVQMKRKQSTGYNLSILSQCRIFKRREDVPVDVTPPFPSSSLLATTTTHPTPLQLYRDGKPTSLRRRPNVLRPSQHQQLPTTRRPRCRRRFHLWWIGFQAAGRLRSSRIHADSRPTIWRKRCHEEVVFRHVHDGYVTLSRWRGRWIAIRQPSRCLRST
jgi:hypothetical protein